MDGSRFDDLIRNLSGKRISRLDAVRSLAATAAAAVAGVTLFANESEARNHGKGPKSNPTRKKKTICHCATFDPASCSTIKPRPKAAKKHLKHQCDYAGPCVAGKVGCPVPSGGGPQPSVECTSDSECAAASSATPCCDSQGACVVPECGDTCRLGPNQFCCGGVVCDEPCVGGQCPSQVCTPDPCTEDADCNGAAQDCQCRNKVNGQGTCGTEEVCSPDECTQDSDCNSAFQGCQCRNKVNGVGTCGTSEPTTTTTTTTTTTPGPCTRNADCNGAVCCADTCSSTSGVCVENAQACAASGGHNCNDQCPGNHCSTSTTTTTAVPATCTRNSDCHGAVCCAATCGSTSGICYPNAKACADAGGHNCENGCPGNQCDSKKDSSGKKRHKKHKSHGRGKK